MPLLYAPPPSAAPKWYGIVKVSAALPISGNPYDPEENDVRVVFVGKRERYERLAFFAAGKWNASLLSTSGGTFTATFTRNGRPIGKTTVAAVPRAPKLTFVRRVGSRFRLSNGEPFVPFGFNFAWQNAKDPSYADGFARMKAAGLNWSRVWANSWDGKNPFIPQDRTKKLPIGQFDEASLSRWDEVVRAAETNGVRIQFVLFHHGLFSSRTDPNWPDHPWNAANGGFLKSPEQFFTDPTAKRLARAWLRYAVARWGDSPAIMAWELFNEVQWTDAARSPQTLPTVAAWHREMGDYLRNLDPVGRLVTSSSGESLDGGVFSTMDYAQLHTYPASVLGAILGAKNPNDRPLFFGEFGAMNNADQGGAEAQVVRDGFWGGLLAGQASPGQYWNWDRVFARPSLMAEFRRLATLLPRTGYAVASNAAPAAIRVEGAPSGDLSARPAGGWEATRRFVYDLPADAGTGAVAGLSGYIQGARGGNRAMMPEPIRLRFVASKAGELVLRIGRVSKGGAEMSVLVNGAPAATRLWPAAESDRPINEDVRVPYPAGRVEITLDNPGPDWFALDAIGIPGIGSGVSAAAAASERYALLRLTWTARLPAGEVRVAIEGLRDGAYEARRWDLETGVERASRIVVADGAFALDGPFAPDEALALFRR